MILQKERTVRMSETDATGIIYFTNLFKFSCEVFEEYLENELEKQDETFHTSDIALPIVDVKGSFKSQITVGDKIVITLESIEKRHTSFATTTNIHKEGKQVAQVTMVHVAISKKTGKKIQVKPHFETTSTEAS